jgi:riboflavin kinase / FMN adenylyltransferase
VTEELGSRGTSVRPAVLTIGSYDGVHRGHLTLLGQLQATTAPDRAETVVITFDPHPRCIVDPAGCPPLLTTPSEREVLLRKAGIDRVVTLRFTPELSQWSAEAFCDKLLRAFALRAIVVGPGFALGRERTGDVYFLRRYGARQGFRVITVQPATHKGAPISSSRIRTALMEGQLGEANAMLGRLYTIGGTVVEGEHVGARLGFPTANLAPDPGRCIPQNGIYASWLEVDGRWRPAATSIGVRPTFGGGDVTIEAHVLDFAGDLYKTRTRLAFVRRLRGERRFKSESALQTAIAADVERVRGLLQNAKEPQ